MGQVIAMPRHGPCSPIDATSTVDDLLPCPFCGSDHLRVDFMYFDDDGEQLGVECMAKGCGANNRLECWNRRAS